MEFDPLAPSQSEDKVLVFDDFFQPQPPTEEDKTSSSIITTRATSTQQTILLPKEIEQINVLLENLEETSSKHATNLITKQQQENFAQKLHSSLWSFVNEEQRFNGTCGDANPVVYVVPVKKAQWNSSSASQMENHFSELLRFNCESVFPSLYLQTAAEEVFSQSVRAHFPSLPQNPQMGISLLDVLFASLARANRQSLNGTAILSANSVNILRRLALLTGSNLLALVPKGPSQDLLIELEDAIPTVPLPVNLSTHVAFHLLRSQATSWGVSLFQPQLYELQTESLLFAILGAPYQQGDKQIPERNLHDFRESDYESLLYQFPWKQTAQLPSEDLRQSILTPVKHAFQHLSRNGLSMPLLSIVLGKILLFVHRAHVNLRNEIAGILVRSEWPLATFLSPLLPALLWDGVSSEVLNRLFRDLYLLNSAQLGTHMSLEEYGDLDEQKRSQHRRKVWDHLMASQDSLSKVKTFLPNLDIFLVPPESSAASSGSTKRSPRQFPLFATLRQMGSAAYKSNNTTLARVVTQELFYFAFLSPVPPPQLPNPPQTQPPHSYSQGYPTQPQGYSQANGTSYPQQNQYGQQQYGQQQYGQYGQQYSQQQYGQQGAQAQMANDARLAMIQCPQEALGELILLLRAAPSLLSWIIHCVGIHLPYIRFELFSRLVSQLRSSFAQWTVDLSSLNWLAYFLTHRTLPQTSGSIDNVTDIPVWIKTFLYDRPRVNFSPEVSANGVSIGFKILESIHWESASPTSRFITLLIILSSRTVVESQGPKYLWTLLLNPNIGFKLVDKPVDMSFVRAFQAIKPEMDTSVACCDELILAQVLSGLGSFDHMTAEGVSDPLETLKEFSILPKLHKVLQRGDGILIGSLLQNLVFRLLHSLKLWPQKIYKTLFSSLAETIERHPEDIEVVILRSLKLRGDVSLWEKLWSLLLSQKVPESPSFCRLYNTLAQQIYIKGLPLNDVSQSLVPKQLNRKDILKLSSNKWTWLAFVAAIGTLPALPKDTGAATIDPSNSRFGILMQVAKSIDPLLALPFWEQFFLLYFEALTTSASLVAKILPPPVKEQLNKHFTSTAQNFNRTATRKAYTAYYSFTTWSRDVIQQEKEEEPLPGRLFDRQTLQVFQTLDASPSPSSPSLSTSSSPSSVPQETSIPLEDQLEHLFPSPVEPIAAQDNEWTSLQTLQHQVDAFINSLTDTNSELAVLKDLRGLMHSFYSYHSTLLNDDQMFLSLTSQLYMNHPEPFSVSIACYRGKDCVRPAAIQGTSIRVGPAYPTVRGDLEKNRSQFNRNYSALFSVARSAASVTLLLHSAATQLLESNDQIRGERMFFELVTLLLEGLVPVGDVVAALSQVASQLGHSFVAGKPHCQAHLLNTLVSMRSQDNHKEIAHVIPNVFPNFTPACVLPADRATYWTLVAILAATPSVAPHREEAIARQFEAETHFPQLMQTSDAEEREMMSGLVASLLAKPSLASLSAPLVRSLIEFNFPENVERMLDAILKVVSQGAPGEWEQIFSALRLEVLDASTAQRMLRSLAARLPLPNAQMPTALHLFSLLLGIPKLVEALQIETLSPSKESEEEKAPEVDFLDVPTAPNRFPIWESIWEVLAASLHATPQGGILSASNFEFLLSIIAETLQRVPLLIDKLWTVYSDLWVPFLSTVTIDRTSFLTLVKSLPWTKASFHIADPTLPAAMLPYLLNLDPLIPSSMICIVTLLDWKPFIERVTLRHGDAQESRRALYFFKLIISLCLLQPSAVPDNLRAIAYGQPSPLGSFPWTTLELTYFEEVFNGRTFVEILQESSGAEDPSRQVIHCGLALAESLQQLPLKPSQATTLMQELRSLLCFSLQSSEHPELYWHLPFSDHIMLLTAVLLPLIRSHGDETTSSQMLVAVLSLMNHIHGWPPAVFSHHPPSFFNARWIPGNTQNRSDEDVKQWDEFNMKLKGIMSQFAGSASPELALELLNVSAQVIHDQRLLVDILEETSHAYFTHVDLSSGNVPFSPITKAAASLQPPSGSSTESEGKELSFLQTLLDSHSSLTLRLFLEQETRSLRDNRSDWTVQVSYLIEVVAKFIPNVQHYEMDLLVLWFFVLELVASDEWMFDSRTEEALQIFQKEVHQYTPKFKTLSRSKTRTPELQLAASACLLYLERLVLQKRSFSEDDPRRERLSEQLEKLLELKGESQFRHLGAFFQDAQDYLSPLYSLPEFKSSLVKSLAPTYPYLQNVQ